MEVDEACWRTSLTYDVHVKNFRSMSVCCRNALSCDDRACRCIRVEGQRRCNAPKSASTPHAYKKREIRMEPRRPGDQKHLSCYLFTPKRIPPRTSMLSIRSVRHPETESRRAPPGAQRDSFANGASGVKFDSDMKHGLHVFRASNRFPPRTPGCTAGLLSALPDHTHKTLPCASMLSIRSARHAGHSGINTTSFA